MKAGRITYEQNVVTPLMALLTTLLPLVAAKPLIEKLASCAGTVVKASAGASQGTARAWKKGRECRPLSWCVRDKYSSNNKSILLY